MARVKRGTIAHKRRRHTLAQTKGFKWGRKSRYRFAKNALYHAWEYAFRDRKAKKGTFRRLWQTKISAASKTLGTPYNKLIALLKTKNIQLDRKTLAQLIEKNPAIFQKIIEKVQAK